MNRLTLVFALAGLVATLTIGAMAHDEVVVTVSKVDCDRLVAHRPAADVAYQPGVDVNGRAVVPADLNGGVQIAVPETIRIPVSVDLFERFGIPANPALFEADAEIGVVTYRDGRAYFNGQPLQDDAAADLSAKSCARVINGPRSGPGPPWTSPEPSHIHLPPAHGVGTRPFGHDLEER